VAHAECARHARVRALIHKHRVMRMGRTALVSGTGMTVERSFQASRVQVKAVRKKNYAGSEESIHRTEDF
jgi:hypothetical protein